VVKVRFEVPRGAPYYRVSREFPEQVAEVTATYRLPNGLDRIELEIVGSQSADSVAALRREPGVVSVSRLATLGPLARFHMVAETAPIHLLERELAVLIRYPILVQDGMITIEVAGRVVQLQKLIEELRRSYPFVEVLRFGRDRMRTVPDSLTPKQYALLHQALAAGYFDVPRRISLTQLAENIGKSKSSVSSGLALVEKKLVESIAASPR
jgi:predicted DNA binding protein